MAYIAEGPEAVHDAKKQELRNIVAENMLKDPGALLLEESNVEEYATWIQTPQNWGGEYEIIELGKHYQMEVAVVNTKSLSILTYTPDDPTCRRCYLLYTGIFVFVFLCLSPFSYVAFVFLIF